MYPLSREERENVYELINKQLRKEYIRFSKLSQTAPVFFVEKKDSKKHMTQDYIYLNKQTIENNISIKKSIYYTRITIGL